MQMHLDQVPGQHDERLLDSYSSSLEHLRIEPSTDWFCLWLLDLLSLLPQRDQQSHWLWRCMVLALAVASKATVRIPLARMLRRVRVSFEPPDVVVVSAEDAIDQSLAEFRIFQVSPILPCFDSGVHAGHRVYRLNDWSGIVTHCHENGVELCACHLVSPFLVEWQTV
jgi:hypothetical protein